mmetsp:Transcript_35128/g.54564  ORF Transcript_35128/g.54564 Transcript_35128/m.54564 type:complete len:368 (-) Transcript_35128:43-1146(-)
MEAPKGPSRDELEKAVADLKEDDLREMAKRLSKSQESLTSMIADLEDENKSFQSENAELQKTIDMVMKELQKLNIGACNTIEPQLDEGPLEFANRMWEKLKPRDTAVVVSEHVGEIKKPVAEEDSSPQNAGEKVRQVVENVKTSVGPVAASLWERGQGAWFNLQSNIQQKLQERQMAQAQEAVPKKAPRKRKEANKSDGGYPSAPQSETLAKEVASKQEATSSTPSSSVDVANGSVQEASQSPKQLDPVNVAPEPEVEQKTVAPPVIPTALDAADNEPGATEEQQTSTILIEAELTLDDGSVQTLQVRAADRCKEVANRFVQEHSLKQWFTDPLTKWLKKVEADAVKFPVKVSGDLMEIRKQFGRSA